MIVSLRFIPHLRSESKSYMSNGNSASPNGNSEIVPESNGARTRSRRTKVRKKIRSSSKTGDSKSEKLRRRLKLIKIVLFAVYGILMLQSMSKMKTDLLYQSVGYNLVALAWLYLLSINKNSKGKSNFKVAKVWLYSHIGILVLHLIIVFWIGGEINPMDQNVPKVKVEKAPAPATEKYVPGDDPDME
jgi:hypothetical protein